MRRARLGGQCRYSFGDGASCHSGRRTDGGAGFVEVVWDPGTDEAGSVPIVELCENAGRVDGDASACQDQLALYGEECRLTD